MTQVIEDTTNEETLVQEPTPEEPQAPEVEDDGAKARADKEARYRLRAKEAESRALVLQQRVEAFQRQEVERVVAGTLAEASDIWLLTNDLTDLLTEDGEVSHEAVLEAAQDLLASRPRLSRREPAHDPSQGRGGGAAPKVGWADFLRTS